MVSPRKNAAKVQGSLLAPDEVAEIPVEEQPYPLPEGWKWAYWGSCGDFIAGNAFKPDFQGKKGLLYPFYKVGSLKFSDNKGYLYDIEHSISEETQKSIKSSIIPEHSIIFAKIGEAIRLNRRSINEKKCCIDNNLMAFVPQKTTYKYVYYWSLGIDLYKYTNATTVPAIRKTDLEKIVFPLPPLDEQQRIVDRIESFFAKLDDAKAKAEAVLDGFEIRKAAILHKAFTGELTAKWREIRGIKKENNAVKIKDILSDIKYGTSEKSDYTYTGLPVIRIPNITGSSVDLEDLKFLKSSKSSDYDLVERNDILMIRSNGSRELVGKCALVDEAIVGKAYASFLIRLRPNPTINPKYLLGFLNSSLARNQLFAKAKSSAGIHNINSKEICSVDIWLPDKKEQQEIVRILDNLLAKERHIREAAENALSQIDLMKKAILARAFRGELGTHGSARDTLQNNGSM